MKRSSALRIAIMISMVVGFFFAESARACGVIAPKKLQLLSSYQTGYAGSYSGEDTKFRVAGCDLTSRGKYIMLAMGPDLLNLEYYRANSYTGYFLDDRCRLEASTLPVAMQPSYEQKLDYYGKQAKVLNTCVEMVVTDESRMGIVFPTTQPGCEVVQRIDRNTVVVRGGYCYFRINPDMNMTAEYRVRPECAQRDFLLANGLNPMDVNFAVNLYVAGDASGHSTDLTHITLTDGRFTIEPEESLMRLSTSFGTGTPRWPVRMAPDFHLGKLEISGSTEAPTVRTGFLVDNRCSETCVDGLCSSPCDYSVPAAAEVGLYELRATGPKLLDFWYQGAIAPPKWMGLVPGSERQLGMNPFQTGKSFRLSYKFAYPDTYYRLARDGFKQFLIQTISLSSSTVGSDTLPALAAMRGLRALYEKMPGTRPLPPLSGNWRQLVTSYADSLATLASYLDFEGWPPYYEEVCDQTLTTCLPPYRSLGQTHLTIDFKIAGYDVDTATYLLEDVEVARNSDVLSPYHVSGGTEILPQVDCSPPPLP